MLILNISHVDQPFQNICQFHCTLNLFFLDSLMLFDNQLYVTISDNAATIIQSQFRRFVARQNYLRVTEAALLLQSAALAWLCLKNNISVMELRARSEQSSLSSVYFC